MRNSFLPTGLLVTLLTAGSSLAADTGTAAKGPNTKGNPKGSEPQASAVRDLSLAEQLAVYGYRTNDAIALLASAQILKSTPTKTSRATKTSAEKPRGKKAQAVDLTAEGVLAKARELAKGRKDLLAIADDVAGQTGRGDVNGPGC